MGFGNFTKLYSRLQNLRTWGPVNCFLGLFVDSKNNKCIFFEVYDRYLLTIEIWEVHGYALSVLGVFSLRKIKKTSAYILKIKLKTKIIDNNAKGSWIKRSWLGNLFQTSNKSKTSKGSGTKKKKKSVRLNFKNGCKSTFITLKLLFSLSLMELSLDVKPMRAHHHGKQQGNKVE